MGVRERMRCSLEKFSLCRILVSSLAFILFRASSFYMIFLLTIGSKGLPEMKTRPFLISFALNSKIPVVNPALIFAFAQFAQCSIWESKILVGILHPQFLLLSWQPLSQVGLPATDLEIYFLTLYCGSIGYGSLQEEQSEKTQMWF